MAGDAVVGTLRALLTLDTADFEQAAVRASKAADRFSKQFKGFGKQAEQLGRTLTTTVTLPIAGVAAGVVAAGIKFEDAFANVRKTVDATEAQFAELEQGFRDLAKTIPVSAAELAELGGIAGQLGVKRKDIISFTETIARLGVSSNLAGEEAATMLARFANITGMARQAEPPFDRLGATIVALGNSLATTESEIVEMGLRLAGVGAQIGLTEPEIMGLAGALSSVGIQAEAGGTAFSRVMVRMQDAVQNGGKQLALFSRVAGTDFAAAFRDDAAGAINLFIAGLARISESGESLTPILKELELGEIRVSDALRRTGNAVELVTDAVDTGRRAWEENAALLAESNRRFETTKSRLIILANNITDVGLVLFRSLKPGIDAALAAGKALLPILEGLAHGFAALPWPIQTATLGAVGLVAATGPVIWSFGQLALATSTVAGALGRKGIAAKALGGTLSALNGPVTGLAAALRGPLGLALAGVSLGFMAAKSDADAYFATLDRQREKLARQAELLEAYRQITGETGAVLVDFTKLTADQQQQLLALAKASGDARTRIGNLSVTLWDAQRGLSGMRDEAQGTTDEVVELSDAVKTLASRLSGSAAADELSNIAQAVALIGGTSQITAYEVEALGERLAELRAQGAVIPPVLADVILKHDQLQFAAKVASDSFGQVIGRLRTAKVAFEDLRRPVALLTDDLNSKIKPLDFLVDNMPGPKVGLPEAPPLPALAVWGSRLGDTITQSLMGGGNAVQAAGAMTGQMLAKSFQASAGRWLSSNLGQTLGGAITSVIPGVGALLGPLAGKFVGWFSGLFTGGEGAKANDLRDSLKADLTAAVKGLENDPEVRAALDRFGRAGSRKDVQAAFDAAMAAADDARQSMQRYGLTLEMVGDDTDRFRRRTAELTHDFANLRAAGFSAEQMAGAMSTELNELIALSLETGQQIPANLAPILETLVTSGQLTDDLAAKLLGVASPAPWKEMEEAAKRYGVSLDQLGEKFHQAKLDEEAQQIAKDFKLLAENGGNVGHVMAEMKDEVQELIDKALKLGLTIPESLRPLIEGMVEGGQLVDENGEKLDDLSRLEFAEPLKDQTDELILKIGELVDALTDGLYPAITNIPRIKPGVEAPSPAGAPDPFANPQYGAEDVPGFSRGGWGNFGAGTPALLHASEAIFPLPQGFDLATMLQSVDRNLSGGMSGQPIQIHTHVEVEGREIARASALYLADEWAFAGV